MLEVGQDAQGAPASQPTTGPPMRLTASRRSTTRGQALAGCRAGLSAQISAALCSWTPMRNSSEFAIAAAFLIVEPSPWAASSSAAAANGQMLGSGRTASLRMVNVSP